MILYIIGNIINFGIFIDLEITDFMNNSPNVPTRTPGQLLSLTSHFSFVSRNNFFYIILYHIINLIVCCLYRVQMRKLLPVVLVWDLIWI